MKEAGKSERTIRVRLVETDSSDVSWDFWDQGSPEERMERIWEIVLDCMEFRGEKLESRLRRDVVNIERLRR